MKKIIRSIIVLLAIVIGISGCKTSSKVSLEDIAKKVNESETVKTYKEYGYELNATSTDDILTLTSKMGETSTDIVFKLDGDILSNDNLTADQLLGALLVIDGVGQVYGYKDGELSTNMNTFPDEYEKYTLDKEGLELKITDEKVSIKIDLTKEIPLIDMNTFYLKADNLESISEIIKEKTTGNQNGKAGNIAYDIFVGEDVSTIQIGQDDKLSDSAYKSILTALEVMYDEDTAKHFEEIYPEFKDGKTTVEAFTIETNYKVEDQENTVFKNTEVVLVTIDNNKLK